MRPLIAQGIRLAGCVAFAAALLFAPAGASAANFSVTNTNDSGMGSLRQAILAANTSPDPTDTITISTTGTVTLLSALPQVTGGTTITGPGPTQFAVSGVDSFQVIRVNSGTVSISGITITDGKCDSMGCNFAGGGIYNSGTLNLDAVTVTDSASWEGGGIYSDGTLTLRDSHVTSNTASQSGDTNAFATGGGVANNGGNLSLVRSTVSGNTVSATGATNQNASVAGGIYINTGGMSTIDRSTVSSNNATAVAGAGGTTLAVGGGISNAGTLTITRSTLNGNSVSATGSTTANNGRGAGIANSNLTPTTIDRSTVSGNTVTAADFNQAGGIDADGTTFTLTSTTVTGNAATSAANILFETGTTVKNTIVSNPQGAGVNCVGSGNVTSQGYNLEDAATCGFAQTTDQPSTNPMLAASLANNGGPTQTYALQLGSPAIDKGQSSSGETVDQRGITRPSDFPSITNASGGDGTDIGAFELSDPNAIIDSGPSGTINDPTPTFNFHAADGASALQCKVDGAPFSACTSPKTTAHLADGAHTFQVRGRDALGNVDPTPASRSFTVKTAAISRSGSTLVVTAAPGAKDAVKITKPSASTIRVVDLPGGAYTGSGVHAVSGSGCTLSGDYTANCSAAGVTAVKVSAADLTDRVRNSTALSGTLLGGPASDILIGGAGNDTLDGGPAADSFTGNNGNDTLLARDQTSDTAINCDGGTKPGTADKAVLDALPKDPNGIVTGCETKSRP